MKDALVRGSDARWQLEGVRHFIPLLSAYLVPLFTRGRQWIIVVFTRRTGRGFIAHGKALDNLDGE
jgi:hypothetical protein